MTYTTLISTSELQALLATPGNVAVFDCSCDLMQPDAGHAQFLDSHIAGAQFADLNQHLSAKGDPTTTGAASGGRHPLPGREAFAAWLGSMGVDNRMQIVAYDRQGMNYCGRLWWMLKWLGHAHVAVLDGGFQAWQAAGGAVASGPANAPAPTPASDARPFALGTPLVRLVDAATVQRHIGSPTQHIVDARGAARFRGETEPIDPVAGHIPGALNRVFSSNLDAQGFFKPADVLRAEFDALLGTQRRPENVVHHCGSGVSAVPNILAMEIAGYGPTALFAGSWSEWISDPSRPVARG